MRKSRALITVASLASILTMVLIYQRIVARCIWEYHESVLASYTAGNTAGNTAGKDVFIDSFATGEVDVRDLHNLGRGPMAGGLPPGGAAAFAAAVNELRLKAESGIATSRIGHRAAHSQAATPALEAVSGFTRLKQNTSGFNKSTLTGVIETTFSRGKSTVTVKIIARKGNVVKVEK